MVCRRITFGSGDPAAFPSRRVEVGYHYRLGSFFATVSDPVDLRGVFDTRATLTPYRDPDRIVALIADHIAVRSPVSVHAVLADLPLLHPAQVSCDFAAIEVAHHLQGGDVPGPMPAGFAIDWIGRAQLESVLPHAQIRYRRALEAAAHAGIEDMLLPVLAKAVFDGIDTVAAGRAITADVFADIAVAMSEPAVVRAVMIADPVAAQLFWAYAAQVLPGAARAAALLLLGCAAYRAGNSVAGAHALRASRALLHDKRALARELSDLLDTEDSDQARSVVGAHERALTIAARIGLRGHHAIAEPLGAR